MNRYIGFRSQGKVPTGALQDRILDDFHFWFSHLRACSQLFCGKDCFKCSLCFSLINHDSVIHSATQRRPQLQLGSRQYANCTLPHHSQPSQASLTPFLYDGWICYIMFVINPIELRNPIHAFRCRNALARARKTRPMSPGVKIYQDQY